MNILFVTMLNPHLMKSGGEQRTHRLWNGLKRHGRVFTFLIDGGSSTSGEIIGDEHPIFKFKPVPIKKRIAYKANIIPNSLTLFEFNLGNGYIFPSPTTVFEGVHFDLIVSRYIYPFFRFKCWGLAPILIDIDDHPEQVFETVNSRKIHPLFRPLGRIITRFATKSIIKKSIGGWISNSEQVHLCGSNYHYLPNIPYGPSSSYVEGYSDRADLFTVGLLNYPPNSDGINRFLRDIWPSFHAKYPDVKYFIAGKGASEEDQTVWNNTEGVEYLGFVDNLENLYQKSLATVVPVYSGGGTCIKTLESMAFSRICLSSKFGVRGLPESVINERKGVLIFDTADSFIDAYEAVLDKDYRERQESLGREMITKYYSIESFYSAIDELINSVSIKRAT